MWWVLYAIALISVTLDSIVTIASFASFAFEYDLFSSTLAFDFIALGLIGVILSTILSGFVRVPQRGNSDTGDNLDGS